jgi:hypothetical protein
MNLPHFGPTGDVVQSIALLRRSCPFNHCKSRAFELSRWAAGLLSVTYKEDDNDERGTIPTRWLETTVSNDWNAGYPAPILWVYLNKGGFS